MGDVLPCTKRHFRRIGLPALYGRAQNGEIDGATIAAVKIRYASVLLVILSIAAPCGIPSAQAAAVPLPLRTPVAPSSATAPFSPDGPVGESGTGAPAGSPRNPGAKPMPAPASTGHYAGPAGNAAGLMIGSRRFPATGSLAIF